MADDSAAEYEALKAVEVEEFYRILDLWYSQKKKEIEATK